MKFTRRQFLAAAGLGGLAVAGCAGLPVASRVALGAAGIAGWRLWPEQGMSNPCLGPLPPELANHDLVHSAWEGLDSTQVWDCHVHIAGTGDSGSGIYLNTDMESLWHPVQYAQRLFYFNASCANAAPGRVDQRYIERMKDLVDGLRPGVKLMLFAFDRAYVERGVPDERHTAFHVPNEYARHVAEASHEYFEWVASVHPYRPDCVEAVEGAAKAGARAVKWLPAAQGMDPASPRCDRFYGALSKLRLPLITHAGAEKSIRGAARDELGNPLRLRRALDRGVRVIVAHCASLGEDRDLDQGLEGPIVPSFDLFARLMENPAWQGQLFGDISAVTQVNRATRVLTTLIERREWHERLLNGSDYPLPGVMPLYGLENFVRLGLIDPAAVSVLTRIRRHNPLLFDFVLKRHLSLNGMKFSAGIFETRSFFASVTNPSMVVPAYSS